MTIAYRPAADADRRFVIGSWLDSFRDSHAAGQIAMADWQSIMWAQVERILARPGCQTIVSCNSEDPTQLHGFVTFDSDTGDDPPLVFYCYVKSAFRRWGIARGLLRTAGIDPTEPLDYAFKTAVVPRLADHIPLSKWQPLAARFPKGEWHRRP